MLRNRKGFTLIELLIVVVIIGILAAIALPKFGAARQSAYYATLKEDLNSLRQAEELYYQQQNHFHYTSNSAELEWTASPGVTIGGITLSSDATNQGWAVTATHNALGSTDLGCAIMSGDGNATTTMAGPPQVNADSTTGGAPVCTG